MVLRSVFAQSVKMALTEDLIQKQHTFGESRLYVSHCACTFLLVTISLAFINYGFLEDLQAKTFCVVRAYDTLSLFQC